MTLTDVIIEQLKAKKIALTPDKIPAGEEGWIVPPPMDQIKIYLHLVQHCCVFFFEHFFSLFCQDFHCVRVFCGWGDSKNKLLR